MTYTAAILSMNEARHLNDEDDTTIYIDTIEVYDESGESVGTVDVESSSESAPYDEAVKELTDGAPVVWLNA